MEKEKRFFWSKTLWVNIFIIGGVFFTDLAGFLGAEKTITIFAVVNLILRVITKTPLKWK